MPSNRFSSLEDSALEQLINIQGEGQTLGPEASRELMEEMQRRGLLSGQQQQAPSSPPVAPPAPPPVGSLVSPIVSGTVAGQIAAPTTTVAVPTGGIGAAPNLIHVGAPGSYAASQVPTTVLGVPLTAGGAGAIAGGAYTGYQQATGATDFVQGNRLTTPQKAALALPTFGTSLFSDQIQDALGLGHKSTKQYQQERWGKLGEQGVLTPEQMSFFGHSPENDTRYGKYTKEFGEIANTDPVGVWGSLGMFETFGKDWLNNLSEQDRYVISRAAIDNGLIKGDKGDVRVTDSGQLQTLAGAARENQDYINEYNAWVKAGRPRTGLTGASTDAEGNLTVNPVEWSVDANGDVIVPTGALVDGEGDEDVQVQLPSEGEGTAPVEKPIVSATEGGELSPEAVALMELNSLLKKSGGRPRARSLILNSLLESTSPTAVDSFSGSELGAGSLINSPLLS